MTTPTPRSPLFPYTTLFRSLAAGDGRAQRREPPPRARGDGDGLLRVPDPARRHLERAARDLQPRRGHPRQRHLRVDRSEEHTSELQSRFDLVCRLLLEKKKK